MALPTATAPFAILLLLFVATTGCSGTGASEQKSGAGCFAPRVGCATPPKPGTGNATAFRASLAPLLAALPSAAAAAEGFAALRSTQPAGACRDRAHALGLCFGGSGGGAASGPACQACLGAAVEVLAEGCANDTRRAGVWSDGCLLAYYDGDHSGSFSAGDGGFQFQRWWFVAGGTRSYPDGLEQTLADLANGIAQPKGQSLWGKARSVVFFGLAAIGTATVVVLLCVLVAGYVLVEILDRRMAAAAGRQAGVAAAAARQGEGIAVYVAGTNGQAPVWSVAAQLRFY